MELQGKTANWSFIPTDEEEDQTIPYSLTTHQPLSKSTPRLSFARSSSASVVSPLSTPGAGSPWSLSPIHHHYHHHHLSPSPSLLYHCLATLQRQDGDVLSIAVSRGIVFTGSDSDRVRIWKQPECIDRGFISTRHGGIRALLAHGGTLFTSHKDRRTRIWTVSLSADRLRCRKLATLPSSSLFRRRRSLKHTDVISCMAYYHQEGLLYTGSWDRTVKVWRVAERRCVDSFVAHEGNVNAVIVNTEDGCLFTAAADGAVKVWRRVFGDCTHVLITALRFQPSPVNALALSGGRFLYSGSSDGSINFWERKEEAAGGQYSHQGFLQGHRLAVLCLAAADRLVFSGSEDATVRVWRREEEGNGGMHVCLAVLEGHRGPVRCVAASVEMEKVVMGFLLYSGSLDRVVKVWRIKLAVEAEEAVAEGAEMEYAVSPVLSPSWVERKLHGNLQLF